MTSGAEYQVRLLSGAEKDLRRLDPEIARRIAGRLRWLASHFEDLQPEPLTGDLAGFFKLRVGSYRVVYEILTEEKTILVHLIGHRRDVYRRR
ncbi:MAG: type II toxin-antitoxin system RelE/ParE family toxin [Caldilineae bacterium]|nr:MAG: type II toxin-antitoxin system RelE/ParE family toxin [Caldilineae bacterium]